MTSVQLPYPSRAIPLFVRMSFLLLLDDDLILHSSIILHNASTVLICFHRWERSTGMVASSSSEWYVT